MSDRIPSAPAAGPATPAVTATAAVEEDKPKVLSPYEYAVIRAVPRVERGEQINVGVVLYSQKLDFFAARTHLHEARLLALDPNADLDGIRAALKSWETTCAGGADGGAARTMKQGERFRWMVAPRSTVVQAGPVHMGLAADPAAELDRLVELLVR